MSITGYVDEYRKLNDEIARLTKRIKELRERRVSVQKNISTFIESSGSSKYYTGSETIHLDKLKPKPKKKRCSPKEKKRKTIEVLMKLGVSDPESAWKEMTS